MDVTTMSSINGMSTLAESRIEQLSQWNAQAREWATIHINTFLGTSDVPQTAASVLTYLDGLPAPAGYELMRQDYARRYHWVRRLMVFMVRNGKLGTSVTINKRRRRSAAFFLPKAAPVAEAPRRARRARSSNYDVIVEGAPEIKGKLETWLRQEGIGPKELRCALIDWRNPGDMKGASNG